MKRIACLLCAILLVALSAPALANSWNLPAGLAGPFERNRDYDSYVRGAADADTGNGKPQGYAFFVMQTQEHAELFVLEQGSKGWSVACRSTKALHQPGSAQGAQCTLEKVNASDLVLAYPGERYTFRYWGEGSWLLWEAAFEGGATMHIREDRANG